VLDDPARIADRRLVGNQQRHHPLAAQLLDLVPVAAKPRDLHLIELDPLPAQLAGDPPAGADPVAGQPASVERGHRRSVPAVQ